MNSTQEVLAFLWQTLFYLRFFFSSRKPGVLSTFEPLRSFLLLSTQPGVLKLMQCVSWFWQRSRIDRVLRRRGKYVSTFVGHSDRKHVKGCRRSHAWLSPSFFLSPPTPHWRRKGRMSENNPIACGKAALRSAELWAGFIFLTYDKQEALWTFGPSVCATWICVILFFL